MQWFDTHAHLVGYHLAGGVAGVISCAKEAGVEEIMCVGTDKDTSQKSWKLAKTFDGIFASAGIHPTHCLEAEAADWDEIVRLAQQPEVVALGETGLDLYWKEVPLAVQQDFFDRHIRLSQQTGLPLVIHLRETQAEIVAMLLEARQRGPLTGIMHSFAGTHEEAKLFLDLGLHISFSGMITYPKNDELRNVAAQIPLHRLLIETDAPYLSPHPFRKVRPNTPALLVHTAAALAEARGMSLAELSSCTVATSRKLLCQRR